MSVQIYLSGLRGAGKTTIANYLGAELGLPVIDGDDRTNEILKRRGFESIGKVTAPKSEGGMGEEGWQKMRKAEADGVKIICQEYSDKGLIWAPGGGVVAHNHNDELRDQNVRNLKAWGRGIYLVPDQNNDSYTVFELATRVHEDNLRALESGKKDDYRHPMSDEGKSITDDPLRAQVVDMTIQLKNRNQLYHDASHITIPTRGLTPEQIAGEILDLSINPLERGKWYDIQTSHTTSYPNHIENARFVRREHFPQSGTRWDTFYSFEGMKLDSSEGLLVMDGTLQRVRIPVGSIESIEDNTIFSNGELATSQMNDPNNRKPMIHKWLEEVERIRQND